MTGTGVASVRPSSDGSVCARRETGDLAPVTVLSTWIVSGTAVRFFGLLAAVPAETPLAATSAAVIAARAEAAPSARNLVTRLLTCWSLFPLPMFGEQPRD